MDQKELLKPDYVFEVSWEVCNKVGGIYTVVSTKVPLMKKQYGDNFILIGPDVWKETGEHPEFEEIPHLYNKWKEKAASDGLNFRVGRWKITGNPIVILVDFTPFFSKKNEIFAHLWEEFHLDSLSGQWDYIEPALFGYVAGRVIESYYEFHLNSKDRIVAHFHEWMTGSGVLHLKEVMPQASIVFTTHATTLGRAIAGRAKPLYDRIELLDAESLAQSYDIVSKFSMEKLSAQKADAFTTVSEITSKECKYFLKREVDVIAPNGFDDSFVPEDDQFDDKRAKARKKLLEVASTLVEEDLPDDTLLVLNSGRYEFHNKGVDLYINSLGELDKEDTRPVVAFIAIPASHAGPNRELKEKLGDPDSEVQMRNRHLTHYLHDEHNDPVVISIRKNGLRNSHDDKVKIIFIPAYLDGRDGIFNMQYYDLLIGFDLTVFPSYYEPWGYTPLESTAFRIPTLTTSLAGFGQWVKKEKPDEHNAVRVVERNDNNAEEVTKGISGFIRDFLNMPEDNIAQARSMAREIAETALWKEFITNYYKAYSIAIGKADERSDQYKNKRHSEPYVLKDIAPDQKPVWNKVLVEPAIPAKLEKLQKLSRNLWWTWNYKAIDLFESIDPQLWKETGNNPVMMLESLTIEQFKKLERNHSFLERLKEVYGDFERYMSKASEKPDDVIAYFSMEYGLHDTLKIYSGGLGMLAGDYLKEASDSNKNIIGVGLLYRYGYFQQSLSVSGEQIANYTSQKFSQLPLSPVRNKEGEWIKVNVALPGRNLCAKAWLVELGRVSLYLLDADIPENQQQDRLVTYHLYGGDLENRFKQELLLGVGGIRLLRELNIGANVYHCNEGHAAFIGLERIRTLIQERSLTFHQALEVVRSSTLFTTHTPVPAGHDAFDEDLLRTYVSHYNVRMGISWKEFMSLGRVNADDENEKFSMSILALKLSQETNGVSRIHGQVSRDIFRHVFDGYYPEELHIGYVTNGVHMPTWAGEKWLKLYDEIFGEGFIDDQSNADRWEKIREVPDERIWKIRNEYREKLMEYLKERILGEFLKKQENPSLGFRMTDKLDKDTLTIGFARRFATYKRAHLLFTNMDRLAAIVNDEDRPLQIIFAGKAHPADKAGQDLIKKIVDISRQPKFLGKIFFVENYEIELAKMMLHGVDVWLNTPTRPLEASGTSGQKAVMNGVLNLSVLDGWWAEGYHKNAGWAIQEKRTYDNQYYQDELDAETIYDIIEEEIIPEFYRRKNGVPVKWVGYIKNSIAEIAPQFTTKRMLDEYQENYYKKLAVRSRKIKEDNCQLAKDIEAWKEHINEAWDGIDVTRFAVPDSSQRPLTLGDDFIAEIEISLNGLSADELGLDLVFGQKENDAINRVIFKEDMKLKDSDDEKALFTCRIPMERVGVFDYAFRLYPKNDMLAHRQDFPLVKWI